MPRLIQLAAYIAPPSPANSRVLTRGTSPPLRSQRPLSGAAKGGAAQDGAEEAHLSVAEEAPRGVERRAERHAATRFVGRAAGHAARRGGCIRPTKYRDAKRREGDGSGDEGVSPEREARTAKRALAGRGSEAEVPRRRDEHPRCHGRQVSPPSAEHTEASRGGLRRTATRRRICIRHGSHGRACRPSGTGRTVEYRPRPKAEPPKAVARGVRNLPCADRQGQSHRSGREKDYYTSRNRSQPMFIALRFAFELKKS